MSRSRPLFVRVLVGPWGDQWIAQGLEYDIAAQGPSAALALRSFVRLLHARIRLDLQRNREPLADLPPAPEHFVAAWERLQEHMTVSAPDANDLPPAYVIQAITENPADLVH